MLDGIEKGMKLKKAETKDVSAPVIEGNPLFPPLLLYVSSFFFFFFLVLLFI